MSYRIESMKVMKDLQPLLQGGIIAAKDAAFAVSEYAKGNKELLKKIVLNPDIPMEYENAGILGNLRQYI